MDMNGSNDNTAGRGFRAWWRDPPDPACSA